MTDRIAESIEYQGHTINVLYDIDPVNPREEYDNLATMVCFHSRYNIGDKHDYSDSEEFLADVADLDTYENTAEEIHNRVSEMKANGDIHILPVYMYDHSGTTISTTPFSCPWDSGQVGFIYVTKETLAKEGLADKTSEEIHSYLKNEVTEYDNFITGQMYGFEIEETGDSCYGFSGSDHVASGLLENAQASIEANLEETPEPGM
jgi:hypothetical protein